MWMMPLHLHVNKKSDYDDDDLLVPGQVSNFAFSTPLHDESTPY